MSVMCFDRQDWQVVRLEQISLSVFSFLVDPEEKKDIDVWRTRIGSRIWRGIRDVNRRYLLEFVAAVEVVEYAYVHGQYG